ncbi:hypothetical protein GIB67_009245 [Kingdonia uniflora]|uniref:DUF7950 domain-containing protein n=1 Tax=Kingdonia uniflora TaxID=39325 RepID=A0A7J7N2M8_9MAGN|nr:hypothetical protein GIB67_009245 [Kingdonia uniflora]
MNAGEGCYLARYPKGTQDTSKVEKIMIRFRPIAPKPVVDGSVSDPFNNNILVRKERQKRRYVKKTLPLLKETLKQKDSQHRRLPADLDQTAAMIPSICDMPTAHQLGRAITPNQTVAMPKQGRPTGSWVLVECVTDTCVDGGLGRTDEERRRNLEKDTCPGFISNDQNEVRWTNEAYKRMVGQVDGEEVRAEMVWLVMKEKLALTYPAFACRVRVQHNTSRKDRISMTIPCDVWKMDNGGFAWRLDVTAALSLGR